jgi:hypothetical protein
MSRLIMMQNIAGPPHVHGLPALRTQHEVFGFVFYIGRRAPKGVKLLA